MLVHGCASPAYCAEDYYCDATLFACVNKQWLQEYGEDLARFVQQWLLLHGPGTSMSTGGVPSTNVPLAGARSWRPRRPMHVALLQLHFGRSRCAGNLAVPDVLLSSSLTHLLYSVLLVAFTVLSLYYRSVYRYVICTLRTSKQ